MDTETLRTFAFEYLKRHSKPSNRDPMQWNYVYESVMNMAKERFPDDNLTDEDGSRLKHVIWDLIIERVLIPGTAHPRTMGDGWPHLSLTEHGRRVVEQQKPVPYDPDGYLANLKTSIPTINDAVLEYVAEAVGTFRTGNNLASAVMLGAASEMVFLELCNAIPPVMLDATKRAKLTGKLKGKMKEKVDTVVGWCKNHRAQLPGTWSNEEQVEDIERIADLIRRRRNDPQDPPLRPTREQIYSYLMVFPEYCKHLYTLKEWAITNAGTVT